MKILIQSLSIICVLAFLAGCQVATQNIPISTVPSGATVYVDGTETCTTPCNPALEKTQDHILTIQKEGYKQADVMIKRKYDTVGVARDAAQASTWGMNSQGAVSNALMTASAKEEDGSAYVLTPSAIKVNLAKKGQPAPAPQAAASGQGAPITINADQLDPADQAKIKNQESSEATITTTEPTTLGSALEDNPAEAAEAALAIGASQVKPIGVTTKTGSSHTSESFGPGSYSKTTTSTKVSGSVSVNPAEAGLELLKLMEDKKKPEETVINAE